MSRYPPLRQPRSLRLGMPHEQILGGGSRRVTEGAYPVIGPTFGRRKVDLATAACFDTLTSLNLIR
jgi:hypothetical protein